MHQKYSCAQHAVTFRAQKAQKDSFYGSLYIPLAFSRSQFISLYHQNNTGIIRAFTRTKWDHGSGTTLFPTIGDYDYDCEYLIFNDHHCTGVLVTQQSSLNGLVSSLQNFLEWDRLPLIDVLEETHHISIDTTNSTNEEWIRIRNDVESGWIWDQKAGSPKSHSWRK